MLRKNSDLGYKTINAENIALENDIEYISKVKVKKMDKKNEGVNRVFVGEGKYILLHPANDGLPTCPIEWYGRFKRKPKMIMDNQSSFKEIINLSSLLLQMIRLYVKYIDEDIFIASAGFAARLDDEIKAKYIGKASLVLTKDSIRNDKVKVDQVFEAKKYFINEFLDHYIGWNFGIAIKNDSELQKELNLFNDLVISKRLREYAGNGFDVWQSKDVVHYKLKML